MAIHVLINDNVVTATVDITTEDELRSLAQLNQLVLDRSQFLPLVPDKGWTFNGRTLSPPVTTSAVDIVKLTILEPAKRFGESVIAKFVAENILMGITQSGKTEAVGVVLRDVNYWLATGSLYSAYNAISALQQNLDPSLAPFVTEERLNTYKNEIYAYLVGG